MAVTSTPANSAIDICARALILIGAEPITSFDDGNNWKKTARYDVVVAYQPS